MQAEPCCHLLRVLVVKLEQVLLPGFRLLRVAAGARLGEVLRSG
jgi:hypothetical protein